MSVSMKASRSSREFSLKLSLAYTKMEESTYITDTYVCRFHAFQDDHAVTGEGSATIWNHVESLKNHRNQPSNHRIIGIWGEIDSVIRTTCSEYYCKSPYNLHTYFWFKFSLVIHLSRAPFVYLRVLYFHGKILFSSLWTLIYSDIISTLLN